MSFDIDTGQQVSSVSLAALGYPIKMELNGDVITVLTFQDRPLQFSFTTVRFDADGKLTFLGEVRPFFWSIRFSLSNPYGLAVDDREAFVGPWLISVDPFIPGFGTIDPMSQVRRWSMPHGRTLHSPRPFAQPCPRQPSHRVRFSLTSARRISITTARPT